MQTAQTSLIARDDTFLGVCAGLGEDLGFDPLLLRVAFALLLFVSPLAALGAYAGAGIVVALSRWLFPSPGGAADESATAEPVEAEAPAGMADSDPMPMAA